LEERPVVHVANFGEWKGKLSRDPWKGFFKTQQSISSKLLEEFKITASE
jgi:hypothetical protein